MPEIRVRVNGLDKLERALGGDLLDDLLRPGFEKSSVVIEGAAKGNVHRVTGKLQQSVGHFLDGRGASLAAHVGPQPGLGQSRHYSEGMTSRWRKPRKGRNTGDPQQYAQYEERGTRYRPGHPFLEPALTDNLGQIEDIIGREANAALERRA